MTKEVIKFGSAEYLQQKADRIDLTVCNILGKTHIYLLDYNWLFSSVTYDSKHIFYEFAKGVRNEISPLLVPVKQWTHC